MGRWSVVETPGSWARWRSRTRGGSGGDTTAFQTPPRPSIGGMEGCMSPRCNARTASDPLRIISSRSMPGMIPSAPAAHVARRYGGQASSTNLDDDSPQSKPVPKRREVRLDPAVGLLRRISNPSVRDSGRGAVCAGVEQQGTAPSQDVRRGVHAPEDSGGLPDCSN